MREQLLTALHKSLWASLRHTFNTDRVLLGVGYLVNFAAFVLLLVLLPERLTAAVVAVACIGVINVLIFLSLRNSLAEAEQTLSQLDKIYADHDLAKYFGTGEATYYRGRYRLWLILQPSILLFAVIVAVAIRYAP